MIDLPFKFIVASSRSIYLYEYNQLIKLLDGGVFFGASKIKDQYIVLNRNNFDGSGGGRVDSVNSLEFLDKNYRHIGSVELDFIKDGHQLFTDSEDSLFITNTGMNVITKITQKGNITNFAPDGQYGNDINHYNSINFYNDKYYITQHRKYDKDDGGVSIFDKDWNFLEYITIGKHVHNNKVKDGFLWVTNSYDGKLTRIELESKNKVEYDIAPGFLTRGLIITDQYLLCGLSEFDTRENRHGNHTGRIRVMKYPEIEKIEDIVIQNTGQINDLLLI